MTDDLNAAILRVTTPTWFCANCCEEWPEPYCDACGRMLTPDNELAPEPWRVDGASANKEAT